jgi:CheY-like chemotaxis protein
MTAIALVTDLLFSTKITGTAKALGGAVLVARSLDALAARLSEAAPAPASPLVIVDLNITGVDPLAAIRAAKTHPRSPVVVAYVSHVQADLAGAARDAGADQVMARSVFVSRLPDLLGPHVERTVSEGPGSADASGG